MHESTIQAILFDAVGTMFRSRGTIGDIYHNVAVRYGSSVPARELQLAFAREAAEHGTPVDRADWKTLVRKVFLDHGPFPRFDEFFEDVYAFFESGQSWMCYPETVTVLQELADYGYQIGVVSNFDRRLLRVLQDLEIARFFSAVVTPDSAGQAKPDPRIFLDATAQLGVSPERTLFVVDDPYLDIAAAKSAGLEAILVNRDPVTSATPAILDLTGLFPTLGIAPNPTNTR